MDDLSFTKRLKILSFIPFDACTSVAPDSFGASRDDGTSNSVIEELVSIATSPTALSNSGRISCLLKCKLRAISRFPLQAFRRLTATPKKENGIKDYFLYIALSATEATESCKVVRISSYYQF